MTEPKVTKGPFIGIHLVLLVGVAVLPGFAIYNYINMGKFPFSALVIVLLILLMIVIQRARRRPR